MAESYKTAHAQKILIFTETNQPLLRHCKTANADPYPK